MGVALAVAVVLRPFQDTPFIDDWVYSWPVQHLLDTGAFLFPELVANPILTQVLWGALFCLPFGFSLTALRVSTWVLGSWQCVRCICWSEKAVARGVPR